MRNNLPEIKLWQQYTTNPIIKQLFVAIRNYMQIYYYNWIIKDGKLGAYTKELGFVNSSSEYLEFYAKCIYNVYRPYYLSEFIQWDTDRKYDSGVMYDNSVDEKVSLDAYKKILMWAYNWKYKTWSVETFMHLVSEFLDIPFTDVNIEFSTEYFNLINISIPISVQGYYSLVLKVLLQTNPNLFNLPLGYTVELTYI